MKFLRKLLGNFQNSIRGVKVALNDSSFYHEVKFGFFIFPIVLISDRSFFGKAVVLGLYLILLAVELLNTAIEKVCDKITTQHDADIKDIKDITSAAVFFIILLNFLNFLSFWFFL